MPVHLPVHNTYVTPDEKFVVAGLRGEIEPGEPTLQVIDAATDKVVWGMELTGYTQYGRTTHEVRPMAFEANADGSVKRMFAQATGINARLGDRLEHAPDRRHAVAAEAAALEAERGRHPDRRHARCRGTARSFGGVGVEPARQPHLRLEPARPEVHRRRRSGPERQLDDADAGQPFMYVAISGVDHTVAVDLQEARHRRQDQDGRAPGADQHRDPALDRVNPTTTASGRRGSRRRWRRACSPSGAGTPDDRRVRHPS